MIDSKMISIFFIFLIGTLNASEEQGKEPSLTQSSRKIKREKTIKNDIKKEDVEHSFSFGNSGSYQCHIKDRSVVITLEDPFDPETLSLELITKAFNNNSYNGSKITVLDIRPPISTLENLQILFSNLNRISFDTFLFTEEQIKKNIELTLKIQSLNTINLRVSNPDNTFYDKITEHVNELHEKINNIEIEDEARLPQIRLQKIKNDTKNCNLYEDIAMKRSSCVWYKTNRSPVQIDESPGFSQFFCALSLTTQGPRFYMCDERNPKDQITEPVSFADIASIIINNLDTLQFQSEPEEITILLLFFPISSFDGFEKFSHMKILSLNVEQIAQIQDLDVKESIIKKILEHPTIKIIEFCGFITSKENINLCNEFLEELQTQANKSDRTDLKILYSKDGSPKLENLLQKVDDEIQKEKNKPVPSNTKFATAGGFLFACALAGLHRLAGPKLYPQLKRLLARLPVTKSVVHRNQSTDNGSCKIVRALFPRA